MEMLTLLLMLIIAVAVLAAWIVSISLIINAIKAKGYEQITTGTLWFIGIFASPMVLGLYAIALPEKKEGMSKFVSENSELPSV